jgi:hypothetical protein
MHTPTPWDDKTVIQIPPNKQAAIMHIPTRIMSEENYQRSKACVNACEGMKDPWADILAMSTDLSVGKSIMDEKDKEIQALRDRVKELEAELAIHNEADILIQKQAEYRSNNPTHSDLTKRHGRESD